MNQDGDQSRRGYRVQIMAVVVFAMAAGVYASSLRCGFVYDDQFAILENEVVTDADRIGDVFTTSYWGSLATKSSTTGYRPITILSYHLTYRLVKANPFWFHALNAVLHALVSVLVFLLVLALTRDRWLSFLSGLVFALHAVHTEAVASIVGRAELLAALFALGALLVHMQASRARQRHVALWILSASSVAVLELAGLLSKETALALPLMALCVDWARRVSWKDVLPGYAGQALAIGSFLTLRIHLFGSLSPATGVEFVDNPMVALSVGQRILASVLTFGKASLLMMFPGQLSSDYAYAQLPVDAPLASGLFSVGVVVLLGLGVLVWFTWRSNRVVAAAVGMALVAYAPVSNVAMVIHTVLGERTLYLPSVGVCLLLAMLAMRYIRSDTEKIRVVAMAVLSVYLVFHAARTVTRNNDWRSDFTLTESDIQVSPDSVRLLNNHGNELMSRGRIPQACRQLRRAVEIHDQVTTINANLGLCVLKMGQVDEAIAIFQDVLAEDPENHVARKHLPLAREMKQAMTRESGMSGTMDSSKSADPGTDRSP